MIINAYYKLNKGFARITSVYERYLLITVSILAKFKDFAAGFIYFYATYHRNAEIAALLLFVVMLPYYTIFII